MIRERLFDRVSIGGFDACWWWMGAPNSRGYGTIRIDGRTQRAHRVVYEYLRGPIPGDHLLHHICENKLCVNPRHLNPVSPRVHQEKHDFKASRTNQDKWRQVTHCENGHEWTPETTRLNHGRRRCKTCESIWKKAWRKKRAKT